MEQSAWKYVIDNKSIMFEGDESYRMYSVDAITQESASNYLSVMGEPGMRPGSFTTNIIRACMTADFSNLAKLGMSFPQFTQVAALISRGDEAAFEWVKGKAAGAH